MWYAQWFRNFQIKCNMYIVVKLALYNIISYRGAYISIKLSFILSSVPMVWVCFICCVFFQWLYVQHVQPDWDGTLPDLGTRADQYFRENGGCTNCPIQMSWDRRLCMDVLTERRLSCVQFCGNCFVCSRKGKKNCNLVSYELFWTVWEDHSRYRY